MGKEGEIWNHGEKKMRGRERLKNVERGTVGMEMETYSMGYRERRLSAYGSGKTCKGIWCSLLFVCGIYW